METYSSKISEDHFHVSCHTNTFCFFIFHRLVGYFHCRITSICFKHFSFWWGLVLSREIIMDAKKWGYAINVTVSKLGILNRWGWTVAVRELIGDDPWELKKVLPAAARCISVHLAPTAPILPQIWRSISELILEKGHFHALFVLLGLFKKKILKFTYALILVRSHMHAHIVHSMPVKRLILKGT